jgi:hypothetical protein
MARIETGDLPLEPQRGARPEAEAALGEEAGQAAAAEADRVVARQRLRIEAGLVELHPELEPREEAIDGDRRFREEMIEATAAHGEGSGRDGGARGAGRQGARRRLRAAASGAAAAVAFLAACTFVSPRTMDEEFLAPLVARAEKARGLRFPAPIQAEQVPTAGVRALLERELDAGYGPEDFARAEALDRSLGLFSGDRPLRDALIDLQAGTVAGFYTPLGRRLYVVHDGPLEAPLPPGVASVAVHELVHALQSATSPLLDVLIGLNDHDDLGFALGALIEGDALWATFRDQAAVEGVEPPRPDVLKRDTRLDDPDAPGASAPRLLREPFLLQYPLGYAIADTLAARGGTAALDAALRNPPLSSEELLHPDGYLGMATRTPLAWFEISAEALGIADCRLFSANTFGELGLRIWLREHGASEARAAGAAEGWDGDRAAVFQCPTGPAIAWLVQLDFEIDAVELASLAEPFASDGLTVERSERRVLLSRGLPETAKVLALSLPELRFADLSAYLDARPEVLERAAELRARLEAER